MDELFWERVAQRRARSAARPRWQKLLIALAPPVLVLACYANFRAGDTPATPEPATARSACGYVDPAAISALFDAPGPALEEAAPQRSTAVTVHSCLITAPAGLRLRLDLAVRQGAVNDDALLAMALTNQTVYSVEGTDGVLTAAKRSGNRTYVVTLTGSAAGPVPLPQDKLTTLSTLITDDL
ncbi:hypothetical protein AB0K00_43420 [Dactylosporangium sp. NPDC049525]|uniref:hypothetical protein n=1 Tax=Dactylosporangium sp. NPDC049525 TaxID=3154730 RepID=UPI0034438035